MNIASLRCMAPDDMNPLYTENWNLDDVDFAIFLGCGKDRCVARSRFPYHNIAALLVSLETMPARECVHVRRDLPAAAGTVGCRAWTGEAGFARGHPTPEPCPTFISTM